MKARATGDAARAASGRSRGAGNGRRRSVSTLLADFGKRIEGGRIRLGDLVGAFARRGHGLLLLLFALPSLAPIYLPGLGAAFGLPIALISVQMLVGRQQPWLPKRLMDRSLDRADYERLVGRAAPCLARVERLLRPRLVGLTDLAGQRLAGLLCLLLALLLSLPVPFTNIPLALPIALIGLALVAHDGLLMVVGMALAAAAIGGTLVFGGKALGAVWGYVASLSI
jgi:hypothetical protein